MYIARVSVCGCVCVCANAWKLIKVRELMLWMNNFTSTISSAEIFAGR